MTRIRAALHKIAHWLHLNSGTVEVWGDDPTKIFVGFRCAGCGKLLYVTEEWRHW